MKTIKKEKVKTGSTKRTAIGNFNLKNYWSKKVKPSNMSMEITLKFSFKETEFFKKSRKLIGRLLPRFTAPTDEIKSLIYSSSRI